MGDVYRAQDTRLGRDVAVKVMKESFSGDPERLVRFEQEARAASLLNHPNIVVLHDIGMHQGIAYVVSELLEGETLRGRIDEGPVPCRRAVEIARPIAHGLAAAHAKGIVHRDLKPENIFLTRDGQVKILDFGLAKLNRMTASDGETMAGPMTEPGIVLGTAGYMSPEQVRGESTDHRSDIFAFGVILYEMLAGQSAFRRDSAVETMNAVLKDDPPEFERLCVDVPPGLEAIVRHCIAKDREERFQSARDLVYAFESLSSSPSAAMSAVSVAPTPTTFHRVAFRRGYVPSARFTPDGETVVYSASWEGAPYDIYSARRGSPESRAIGGLRGSSLFSISSRAEMAVQVDRQPAGPWLNTGTLARVPLGGGAPRRLVDEVCFADWSPDGRTLAIVREVGGRIRLEHPAGKVVYETAGWISDPRVSPRGDSIAFIEHPSRGWDGGNVVLASLESPPRVLSREWLSASGLAWTPSGEEVWFTAVRSGISRSIQSVSMAGRERTVFAIPGMATLYDISRQGHAILGREQASMGITGLPPGEEKERDLSWFDWSLLRDVTADGRWILFDETGEGGGMDGSVYLRDGEGSPAIRLGDGAGLSLSSDGKYALALSISRPELSLLPTGAGEVQTLRFEGFTLHHGKLLPDGRIIILANRPNEGTRLFLTDRDGSDPRAITPEGTDLVENLLSPDGKWLTAEVEGTLSMYSLEGNDVRPIRGVEKRERPLRWSEDGRFLFAYTSGQVPARVFKINLETGERELWMELMPSDPAGVLVVGPIQLTADLKGYYYSFIRVLSDLYVVEGLK